VTEPRRSRFRRPPSVHRPPALPAPETPEEVLERAPDVSRETSAKDAESAAWASLGRYVAGGQVPDDQLAAADLEALTVAACSTCPIPHPVTEPHAPALSRAQVLRLEALTAQWEREVRLEGPADATLLYVKTPPPPPPPAPRRPVLELVDVEPPAPPPAPGPVPATRAEEPAEAQLVEPARVSDWTSRHDPRSLEYPVRQLLARPVPLADVSLPAVPVLDQGTTPPLDVRTASACGGMAGVTAANLLSRRGPVSWSGELLEEDARRLYFLAQDRDHVHGHDYAGTSVLGIMRAGVELGLWPAYLWALGGTRDVAQVLLQVGLAVVVGLPWSTQLEEPDAAGIITPGGRDNGGHALAVVGLRLSVGGRPGPWFELQQSRGPLEGVRGRVFMHHRDLARLLAGVGEAAVPLPGDLA